MVYMGFFGLRREQMKFPVSMAGLAVVATSAMAVEMGYAF